MSGGKERRLLLIVWQNFIKSLKPRQIRGNKMGTDYLGNKYFEIPAREDDGSRHTPRASRWYDPPPGKDFSDPLPAEWEAWLRLRRKEVPTKEEIDKNLAIMRMKKENAEKLEQERIEELKREGKLETIAQTPRTGFDTYPKYKEYHYGEKHD